jgi:hypothetical protein
MLALVFFIMSLFILFSHRKGAENAKKNIFLNFKSYHLSTLILLQSFGIAKQKFCKKYQYFFALL